MKKTSCEMHWPPVNKHETMLCELYINILFTGKSRKYWQIKPKWVDIENQTSSKEEKQTGALSYPVTTKKKSADITLSGTYSIWFSKNNIGESDML